MTPLHTLDLAGTWARRLSSTVLLGALAVSSIPAWAQAPTQPPNAPLQALPSLDLQRYQGRWYQIAYYPNVFQKQCVQGTTAFYQPTADGQITVTNTCQTADGRTSQAVGLARPQRGGFLGWGQRPASPTQLEVRFAPAWLSWLPQVWGSYWVIQLADDYRYTVVGEPQRQFLWILSRTPTLSAADRNAIHARLVQQGYDPAKLQEEPQPQAAPARTAP